MNVRFVFAVGVTVLAAICCVAAVHRGEWLAVVPFGMAMVVGIVVSFWLAMQSLLENL